MHRFAFVALLLAITTPAFSKNAVTITFEERAVIANVTPGAGTAWFSITQQVDHRGPKLINRAFLLADDDRDGVVKVTLRDPLSFGSFWMVVDMSTGEHAIESPGERRIRSRALPSSALKPKDNNGSKARLQHRIPSMTVFVARPGVGAWFGRMHDGSAEDADGTVDGHVTSRLDRLKPLDSSPAPPDDYQKDDVVAFVDPLTLELYAGRVVK